MAELAKIPETVSPEDDEQDFGVEALPGGDVALKFGTLETLDGTRVRVAPFTVPPDEAIKLAAVMLKKAGCKVAIGGGVLTARFGKSVRTN